MCLDDLCDFTVVYRLHMGDNLYYHTRDLYCPAHVYILVSHFRSGHQVEIPEYC